MLLKFLKSPVGEGVCMRAHVCDVSWADGGEGSTRQGRVPKVKIHFISSTPEHMDDYLRESLLT